MEENQKFWTYLQHLKAQKHQFVIYMKSKDANFPYSLLQQFNFGETEEAEEEAPPNKGKDDTVGKEREWEFEEDYQIEHKETNDAEAETENLKGEEEDEGDTDEEKREEEIPKVTCSSKYKEKMLEEYESESD